MVGSPRACGQGCSSRSVCRGEALMQLVIRNGRLDGELVDVFTGDGAFVSISPAGTGEPHAESDEIGVGGALLSPPYGGPHVHLDTCLTAGEPRWNESGTLWEGIACWSERKAT